jgi:hypothetical protein
MAQFKYIRTTMTNENYIEDILGADQIWCMLATVSFRICCIAVSSPKVWRVKYKKLQF